MQVNDGAAEPLGGSVMEDSVNHRMFPGDGDFDLVGYLQAIGPATSARSESRSSPPPSTRCPPSRQAAGPGAALRAVAATVGIDLS